ncbi:MAG: SDR family oxidoreductase [Deltaproteobacteria bacterium]|nr:SDR family oxidoreductase [Deltaproteobacteria bacterium]
MTPKLGKKILLLGASGLLGGRLAPVLRQQGHEVVTHSRASETHFRACLTDQTETEKLLDAALPDIIINLSALTDVEKCELEPAKAYLENVHTVENVVEWIKRHKEGCFLVQISTDQVYDNEGPHAERDVTITNYYGFSKFAGELVALTVPSVVLRVNFFGRSHTTHRESLSDWIYRSITTQSKIQVFDDVFFSPLSMETLSELINVAICKRFTGVFNLGSRHGMSKSDFAFLFAGALKLPTSNMTKTSKDRVAFLKAYRPKDMRMDCSKFEKQYGRELPNLESEIIKVSKEYCGTS